MPEHNHVHEQILFVQSGKFELALEGEKITVKKNELVVIPSNKNHSGIALSDCKLIDFLHRKEKIIIINIWKYLMKISRS